jgi:hypothetical protein
LYNRKEGNLKRGNRTMTINELIQRLQECGDEKFRDTAKVRIIDNSGDVVGEDLDVFDVKDGANSVDIHIPY